MSDDLLAQAVELLERLVGDDPDEYRHQRERFVEGEGLITVTVPYGTMDLLCDGTECIEAAEFVREYRRRQTAR